MPFTIIKEPFQLNSMYLDNAGTYMNTATTEDVNTAVYSTDITGVKMCPRLVLLHFAAISKLFYTGSFSLN
jgi:hypothetical protein